MRCAGVWRDVALAGIGAMLLAGCADVEGLHRDGPAVSIAPPAPLWPGTVPSPAPTEQQRGQPSTVPGAPAVASGDMRDADPLAVIKADAAAAHREDQGTSWLVDQRVADRFKTCTALASCGVRKPIFRDLTGDGRSELVTAVDVDGRLSEMRVYHAQKGGAVVRVLSRRAVLEGVEVAAGHLAIREPTSNPSLVYVSHYVWDGSMIALHELKLDSCRTLKDTSTSPCAKPSPRPEAR